MHMFRQLMPGPIVKMADLRLRLEVHIRHAFFLHLSADVRSDGVEILAVFVESFEE